MKSATKRTKRGTVPPAVSEVMAEWGKRGGQSTSAAKRRASALNGKLGGRPPKIPK